MYIAGLVIPVPADKMEAYRQWAAMSAAFFREYGCRRAVAAKEGEKIVFAWQIWPSREALDAAEDKMHGDPRMEISERPSFAPKRLILGCFTPIHTMGRAD